MKKYFFTGLAILVPVFFTFWLLNWLVNGLTKPFIGPYQAFLLHLSHTNSAFFALNDYTIPLLARLLVIATLITAIIGVGMLGRFFFFNSLFRLGNAILKKIPIISSIYRVMEQVTKRAFGNEAPLTQAVLVPFPKSGCYAFGFVSFNQGAYSGDAVTVIVPQSPNITFGIMLTFPREDVIFLDGGIEETIKSIISCGLIFKP